MRAGYRESPLLCLALSVLTAALILSGCGGGGSPAAPDPGGYVSPLGVAVQAADPAALQVIDFTPRASVYAFPITMLAFSGTAIGSLVWSTTGAPSDAVFPLAYADLSSNDLFAAYPWKNVRVRITTGSADLERTPAWNSNTTYLAYTAANHLYKIRANGTGRTQLTSRDNLDNGRPEWSPDGTKIVFHDSEATGAPKDIWVMNADGSGLSNLTGGSGKNQHPTWTEDGREIIWSRDTGTGAFHLWRMTADGSGKRQITNYAGQSEIQPCAAARDNFVAYTQVVGGDMQIAVKPEGGPQQVLTTEGVNQWPTVSPNGEWIAFQSTASGNQDVWMIRRDGALLKNVTLAPGSQVQPSWKTSGFYHVALGPGGTDGGFNPPLGSSAQAALAVVGAGSRSGDDFAEESYFTSCSVNAGSSGTVTVTKVEGESAMGLIDVMATTSLVVKEDLFRGAAPRAILGGAISMIPGSIKRAILIFEPADGTVVGVLSFAGSPVVLGVGPAPTPYRVVSSGGDLVLRGDFAGLWTASGGYRSAPAQVTITADGRLRAE